MVARARNRGRLRSALRFVALVLALAIPAGALTVAAVVYDDRIGSIMRPGSTSATEGADGTDGSDRGVIGSTALPRDCTPDIATSAESSDPIGAADPESILVELSRRAYPCADRVVVVGADPAARQTGARLAMDQGATLLLSDGGTNVGLRDELTRLAPDDVTTVGVVPAATASLAGGWNLIEQPADPGAPPPTRPVGGSSLWVLGPTDPDLAALLTPLASQVDAEIVELPGPAAGGPPELFGVAPAVVERLRSADHMQLIGPFTETETWQLEALRSGFELAGGGLTVLPDRRYIAFYGAPGTSSLGVLGEQDPAATLERMRPLLAEYQTDDGVVVVPTFELITTVAAAEAGDDGDYSNETSVTALRPYVDFAADNGIYVLLDLQPGRTDFLTQAKLYEELLVEPHVGLALDPEWRLAPDQVHLRQLGSVDASEVNEVSAWLAELVRTNTLPQKMLLIHQFQQSMVTNRSAIEERPELSLVIQMDGQGPLGTKYGTLAALIRNGESGPWRWGWKNFYDEDTPMATPAQTLAVDPRPVYVSYQ